VTLYQDNKPPRFQLLEYNTEKTKSKVKICKISNENYAKIEVYRKQAETSDVNDFFLNQIDKLENLECQEKELDLSELKQQQVGTELKLVKKEFNFDDLI
jgi:lipoate-protein ligase A